VSDRTLQISCSYISFSRSQSYFIDTVDIWKFNWLEILERYREAYHKHGILRTPMEIFTRNSLRSVACIKTYGSLDEILMTIEEGDQSHLLIQRVKHIREDKELMDALRQIWKDDSVV
jgi:hypothetical protein